MSQQTTPTSAEAGTASKDYGFEASESGFQAVSSFGLELVMHGN